MAWGSVGNTPEWNKRKRVQKGPINRTKKEKEQQRGNTTSVSSFREKEGDLKTRQYRGLFRG